MMRIIASRRASVLGAVSHDAGNTTPQGYGMGTAVMRCVASQRAAHQAGTSRHIAADRIGNVSSLSLLFGPQNLNIVSPFFWFNSLAEQL